MSNPGRSQTSVMVASIPACGIDVTDFLANTEIAEELRSLTASAEMTITVHDAEKFEELLALARQAAASIEARQGRGRAGVGRTAGE